MEKELLKALEEAHVLLIKLVNLKLLSEEDAKTMNRIAQTLGKAKGEG